MPSPSNIDIPKLLHAESQSRSLRIAVVLLFCAVVLLSAWRVIGVLHRPGDVPAYRQGLSDFHHIFVFPAMAARDGVNPYAAEFMEQFPVNRQYPLYSPATFWLAYPLTFVSWDVADVFYFSLTVVLSVALAVSALYVCRLPQTIANVFGLSTLVLLSRPGHVNLLAGQPTLFVVLGAVWALELARSRPNWAGFALAVTTLKPTFGVPMIWFMICRRDFRAVCTGIAISAVTIIAGLAPFVARDGVAPVLQLLRESQAQHEADPTVAAESTWTRLDTQALVSKLLSRAPNGKVELALTASILLAAGWLVWRTPSGPLTEGADNLTTLLIVAATLACIYHATYDALLLVVPWVGVLAGKLKRQLLPRLSYLTLALLTIPAVSYFASRTALDRFVPEGSLWTALTSVNSVVVIAILLISGWSLVIQRTSGIATAPANRLPKLLASKT